MTPNLDKIVEHYNHARETATMNTNLSRLPSVSDLRSICKEFGLKLRSLKRDEGYGGTNYACCAGDTIFIAPFERDDTTDDCEPRQLMAISFFHEFAHCRLKDKVPNAIEGENWSGTTKYQYELWITMLGLQFAQERGFVFPDNVVVWLINKAKTYISTEGEKPTKGETK